MLSVEIAAISCRRNEHFMWKKCGNRAQLFYYQYFTNTVNNFLVVKSGL